MCAAGRIWDLGEFKIQITHTESTCNRLLPRAKRANTVTVCYY